MGIGQGKRRLAGREADQIFEEMVYADGTKLEDLVKKTHQICSPLTYKMLSSLSISQSQALLKAHEHLVSQANFTNEGEEVLTQIFYLGAVGGYLYRVAECISQNPKLPARFEEICSEEYMREFEMMCADMKHSEAFENVVPDYLETLLETCLGAPTEIMKVGNVPNGFREFLVRTALAGYNMAELDQRHRIS